MAMFFGDRILRGIILQHITLQFAVISNCVVSEHYYVMPARLVCSGSRIIRLRNIAFVNVPMTPV